MNHGKIGTAEERYYILSERQMVRAIQLQNVIKTYNFNEEELVTNVSVNDYDDED